MKFTIIGALSQDEKGSWRVATPMGKGSGARTFFMPIADEFQILQLRLPISFIACTNGKILNAEDPAVDGTWLYRNKAIRVENIPFMTTGELQTRIKHKFLSEEKQFAKLVREIEAFENLEKVSSENREQIPADVRLFVWQRDGGKCARCGSRERLEYDHIIPVSKGGNNTARNIELLCEMCNRRKGGEIQ